MTTRTYAPFKYTEEVADYLNTLRDSGATNMLGAAAYLQRDFDMDKREAKDCLLYWIASFKKETT
jgi:hypothetical protein